MNADIIASQIPLAYDYIDGFRAWWNTSRHPVALKEVVDAGLESSKDLSLADKAIVVGTGVFELIELSPLNETIIARIGGTVLRNTGDIARTVAAVGLSTGVIEIVLGLGTAYSLSKLEPSVRIFQNNYLERSITSTEAETSNKKSNIFGRAATLFSVSWASGAGGATLYAESKEENRSTKDRIKTAASVAGMLALYDATITLGLTKGAALLEDLGLDGATRGLADFAKNPFVVFGLIGAIIGGANWRGNRKIQKRIKQQAEVNNTDGNISYPEIKERKITHLLRRLYRRKQTSRVQ